MNKKLEKYLDTVDKCLKPLPASERVEARPPAARVNMLFYMYPAARAPGTKIIIGSYLLCAITSNTERIFCASLKAI